MALEQQLGLGVSAVDGGGGENSSAPSNDGGDDGVKTARLPRWTRQEILVLIQGKRVAENRVRRGRAAGMALGSGQLEPKWASVSSYCRRHGVNRGPVQCRKRWSNLAGDYKKIKEWESQVKEETESYWVMRNDVRREKKLPGFFDKEVYDIVDGGVIPPPAVPTLSLGLAPASEEGLLSDFDRLDKLNSTPVPKSVPDVVDKEKQAACGADQGRVKEKHPGGANVEGASTSQEERKRKRTSTGEREEKEEEEGETKKMQNQLIEILERNGQLLAAQLEVQNLNLKLDREQRKDHGDSLVAVLNKLADAVTKIADKL
ncbi:PREDICTED: trihelix transcription factor ASR3-like [Camelina sativa]|uniref:Trihelix transcription factor ASR3-like n=1 Tax=Camelina sativa TaxID=90675 RepID=A0ABM0Z3E8_CAMSA|nr:PREDICTED: trihelix transcription factor ASR3-like [Camelina sativa]